VAIINTRAMSLESTVSVAKVGTNSVRATVPEGIVAFLDLKVGDKLVWKMDYEGNDRYTIVRKKIVDDKSSVELARFAMKQKRARQDR
jgi:hypothetical protein